MIPADLHAGHHRALELLARAGWLSEVEVSGGFAALLDQLAARGLARTERLAATGERRWLPTDDGAVLLAGWTALASWTVAR